MTDAYILDDSNFERDPLTGAPVDSKRTAWFVGPPEGDQGKWLGHAMAIAPFEAHTSINITTPPGMTTGIMISLLFQLGKWEYLKRVKVDEWIEVNPAFSDYYQRAMRQKEEMEARIKSGLASAAQAVADMELLKHDQRKYREFLDYVGYRTKRQIDVEDKKKPPKEIPDDYDLLYTDEDEKKTKKKS